MAAAKSSRRFYQNGRVSTELGGPVTRSVFQHTGGLLAQRTSGAEASLSLMAVETSNTVMMALEHAGNTQYRYTPYGQRTALGNSKNPLGFNGEQLDPVTGCYPLGNGYRLFSPTRQQMCSPDSESPFGKGWLNAYGYCTGDPINNIDPTGHFPLSRLLTPALFTSGIATLGTLIAGVWVKDPKTRDILLITSGVFSLVSMALVAGPYVHYRAVASRLRNRVRHLENKLRHLENTAPSNRTPQVPASTTQPQIPSGVNESVYFSSRADEVALPHLKTPPSAFSQTRRNTYNYSAQERRPSSAGSDSLSMRGFRQHT